MRAPALGAVTLGMVLMAGLASVALALTQTAADDFSSGGYAGSTGTFQWAGHWEEVGESDGPNSGVVQVQSGSTCAMDSCLTVEALVGLLGAGGMRDIDLSDATAATLRYRLAFPGGLLASGRVIVDTRISGGGWQELKSHDPGEKGVFSADLPVGNRVTVRFRATDLAVGPTVGFDDMAVEITLLESTTASSVPLPTTTTPTTLSPSSSTTTTEHRGEPSSATGSHPVEQSTSTTTARTGSTTTVDRGRIAGTNNTRRNDGSTDEPPPSVSAVDGEEDPGTKAVVRNMNPRLVSSGATDLQAQRDLLVLFGLAAEDIRLDILGSVLLGLILGWASLKRLD